LLCFASLYPTYSFASLAATPFSYDAKLNQVLGPGRMQGAWPLSFGSEGGEKIRLDRAAPSLHLDTGRPFPYAPLEKRDLF
jgi:hypothetical protein